MINRFYCTEQLKPYSQILFADLKDAGEFLGQWRHLIGVELEGPQQLIGPVGEVLPKTSRTYLLRDLREKGHKMGH